MDRKPLLFSQSNAYFPYEELLEKSIGFSNPLNIDNYIKQSFGLLTENLMLTWAEVQCFNKDHLIEESFLCYKIEGKDHKKIIETQGMISCNLKPKWFFGDGMIQSAIQGTPFISMMILWILTSIAPAKIANILMYVSVFSLLITCIYYGIKMIKRFIRILISKELDYDGIGITFDKPEDRPIINNNLLPRLKQLRTSSEIDKMVIFEGNIFFKQTINKKTIRQSIKEKFSRSSTNGLQNDSTTKIQQTVSTLLDQNLFM